MLSEGVEPDDGPRWQRGPQRAGPDSAQHIILRDSDFAWLLVGWLHFRCQNELSMLPKAYMVFSSSLLIQLKLAFTLDRETGLPQGCHIYEYRDSNK